MARIPEREIERLKREVSLERLIEARGIQLKRHGADLHGLCPFHDDREPSLVITPSKNLWHCLGACQMGGSVIDWVMKTEGVSFRHAVELLREDQASSATAATVQPVKRSTVQKLETPLDREADDGELLRQVISYYHETLKQSPEALAYLEKRGLQHPDVIERFKLGYANRTLAYRLPARNRVAGAEMRGRLQQLGILRESGHEHFNGSFVIPVFDEHGAVREVYGRKIRDDLRPGTPLHLYLPGEHRGVWNWEALAASREIILCEALIDALTFWVAGFRNVTASYGVEGFTEDHLAAFHRYGTERVLIAYDRGDAGEKAAQALAEKLLAEGIGCYRIHFPKDTDANEYARTASSPQNTTRYGGINVTSPFRQTYTYDVFDNLTSRSGTLGYQSNSQLDTASFTNHRRDGWSYDLDGRLTASTATASSGARSWLYDAAGRAVVISESGSSPASLTLAYDGDGRSVYESAVGGVAPATYYLVRSSVLGGEVVTRLTSSGSKAFTYVAAGGLVEARQTVDSYDGQARMEWTHRDPLGVTEYPLAAYDPLGNYVRHEPPAGPPQPPPSWMYYPAYSGAWSGFGNAANYATGCVMDGQPTSCDRVARALENGSAVVARNSPSYTPGPGGAAFIPITFTRTLKLNSRGGITDTITPGGRPGASSGGYSSNYASWTFTTWVPTPGKTQSTAPPTVVTVPIDADQLKELIQERLKYGDCAEYVKNLITMAASLPYEGGPAKPFESTSLIDLFEKIRSQPTGGVLFQDYSAPHPHYGHIGIPSGGGGWAWGSYLHGNATINVVPIQYYGDRPPQKGFPEAQYGLRGAHEVIHLSSKWGTYSDAHLTRAARMLEPNMRIGDWDSALKRHCLPPEYR